MQQQHLQGMGLVGVEPTTSRLSDSADGRSAASVPPRSIDVSARPVVSMVGETLPNGDNRRSKTEHGNAACRALPRKVNAGYRGTNPTPCSPLPERAAGFGRAEKFVDRAQRRLGATVGDTTAADSTRRPDRARAVRGGAGE